MAEHAGREGVWVVYDYSHGPYFIAAYGDPIEALKHQSFNGYGRSMFLPYGMDLREGEAWFFSVSAAESRAEFRAET